MKLCLLWVLAGGMFTGLCRGATVTWVGGSGDWGDLTKWSGGAVPGPLDDVVIDTSNGAITVTVSSGSAQVNSVSCEETLLLNGGAISGGTVTTDNGGALVVQSGAMDGVTVNGVLDVGRTVSAASLMVTNGLVLNGTAYVGGDNGYGAIGFSGSQVLGGGGTVVFGRYDPWGNSVGNALWLGASGTTLVIGSGITVRGQNGTVGAAGWPRNTPGNVLVFNQGAISADVGGGTIVVSAQPMINAGTVAMSNGGSLNLNYLPSVVGLSVGGSGALTLNGNWENDQVLSTSGATLILNGGWTNSGVINVNGGTLTLNGSWRDTGMVNATNATVNLGGMFTLGALATFNPVGCTINLTGTLNNLDGTVVSDPATAAWALNGGTVHGGVIAVGGAAPFVVQSGLLDGVTVNGVMDVGKTASGASLMVTNGLALNGTAYVGGDKGFGAIGFAGSQALGGGGTVVFGGSNPWSNSVANALWLSASGTTLVIGSGITVRGQNGTVGAAGWPWSTSGSVSVVNQGTISADVSGGTIVVNAQPLVNGGTVAMSNGGSLNLNYLPSVVGLSVGGLGMLTLNGNWENDQTLSANGATLSLNGGWTNAGTINVNGGSLTLNGNWPSAGMLNATNATVNLGGTFTIAALAAFNPVGCAINLAGTLNNTNGTLALSPAAGSWVLNGGVVRGGLIIAGGAAPFVVQSGALDGVTVNGVLDVGNTISGASLMVTNGLALNGTAYVGGDSGYGAIGFAGSQLLGGGGTVIFGGSNPWGNSAGNALWLGVPGTTLVIGSGITVRGQNGTVGAAGWPWSAPGNVSVVNQGLIAADVNGGTIAISAQPLVNAGTVAMSNGGSLSIDYLPSLAGLSVSGAGALTLNGNWRNDQALSLGGTTLSLNGNWTNAGVLTLIGGTLNLNGSWSNAGIVNATNATVNLGGVFTVGALGTFHPGGCVVNLTGTLDNTNGTLAMSPAIGPWLLNGGVVRGGVITADAATPFVVRTGALDGVTINGVLDVGNTVSGASLTVTNGLVLNGTANVGGDNGYGAIGFAGSQVLGGGGTVVFGGANPWGNSAGNALWLGASSTTLAIGSGITVRGQNGTVGTVGWPRNTPGNVSVVNHGTISADMNGGTIVINAQPLVNAGTVAMSNGGSLNINYLPSVVGLSVSGGGALTLNGNWENDQALSASGATLSLNGGWTNLGMINLNGGTLTLNGNWSSTGRVNATNATVNLGGTFTVGALGSFNPVGCTVNLTGALNNTNRILALNPAIGSWVLNGGSVHGGVITGDGAAPFVVQSGVLDGVTVNGVLDVGNTLNGANLTVINGMVLNGTAYIGGDSGYGAIGFTGNQILGGGGTVVFGSSDPWGNSAGNALWPGVSGATLVIGSGITVRGRHGTIGAAGWPRNTPGNVSVVNQGTIVADVGGGTVVISGASFANEGQLVASGEESLIRVTADTVNTGVIEADHGSIAFSGRFTQNGGAMDFGLASPTDFGRMDFTGPASVGGTLGAQLEGGYVPNPGDAFALFNAGSNSVAFTNLAFPAGIAWKTDYSEGALTLAAIGFLPTGVGISPGNQSVAVGATVSFEAAAGGPGPLGYQWLWNGVVLSGATNATLVLSNVTFAAIGAYTVEVSNPSGSVLSAPAALDVLTPPAIATAPPSQTASLGATVTFLATATGAPPLSYQWSFDGQALAGATNASLTLTNVARAQAGGYSLVVTNLVGSATSAPPALLSIATGVPCPETPPGMVAWWRGEGNTGDYAGTNDVVFEGAAGYGPGEVGRAFLFDGVSSYLETPNNPAWAFGANDFSIELWANFSGVFASDVLGAGSVVFIGQDEGLGPKNKWLFGFGGGLLYFYMGGPALAATVLGQATFTPLTNQWYHLALTKGSGVYRIYVNGRLLTVETNSVPVPVVNAPLTIGQAQGLFMDGLLDEIALYNRALVPAEIQAIYRAGASGKCGLESGIPITLQAQVGEGNQVILLITGGQVGDALTVEATEDFKQWSQVGALVKSAYTETFMDPTPIPPVARFYRVR